MMINGLSGIWCFQRIVLQCRCITLLFGRPETQLKRGDYWHCLNGHKGNYEGHGADVLVIDVLPVTTIAEREALTAEKILSK